MHRERKVVERGLPLKVLQISTMNVNCLSVMLTSGDAVRQCQVEHA